MLFYLLAQVSPKPYNQSIGDTFFEVGKLQFTCRLTGGGNCSSVFAPLLEAYTPALYPKGIPEPANAAGAITEVTIALTTEEYAKDILAMDEQYSISVTQQRIEIKANSPDGLARAIATLCQIIEPNPASYYENGKYVVYQQEITDKPVYRYRQLLVDSARHYLSLGTLKRISLGLSLAKINVLHVHIVDSYANAFAAETAPADNMQKAAWTNGRRFLLTKSDIKNLYAYIRPLGMILMVEYDMPGHASSWRSADGSIVSNCPGHSYSSINPINELTYQYIEAYIRDVFDAATYTGATPIIHLGGDEVDHNCWNEDKEVLNYMNANGLSTVTLWQQFHSRVVQIVQSINPNAFIQYWQESFENGNQMVQNSIVNFWANMNELYQCLESGHYAVRTQGWYFDVVYQGQSRQLFQDSWMDFYTIDIGAGLSQTLRSRMLGGGACLWGEYVDGGSIDDFAFPRIIAVSESLWTAPADRTITDALTQRMNEFACKSQQIGVKNGPLAPSRPCVGVDVV